MRLDYALCNAGVDSRRAVKSLIMRGAVSVEGVVEKNPAKTVVGTESVFVNGKQVDICEFVYIMLNKPIGFCCTNDEGEKNVFELLPNNLSGRRLSCVGRLDKDTEGLLLITDDGAFSHKIISPKSGCEKTYIATLAHPITDSDIEAFALGMELANGEKTLPARLERTNDESIVKVTLSEGKYHQVKRMFGARQNRVIALKRISVGAYWLPEGLEIGQFTFFSPSIEKKS